MDFEEVIKDNELEEVSSIELISIMNKVIEVLKERIDDTEEDDFDIELDEMETDELCEFATAVMMVLTGRVEEDADKSEEDDESDEEDKSDEDDEGAEKAEDSDEEVKDEDDDDSDDEEDDSDGEDEDGDDDEDEVNESYITEASKFSMAGRIMSGARDISVLATKADLHKALEKVPSRIKKTAEFADAMKYAKGRKKLSPETLERIKNSKLGEWMSNYSEANIKKGNLKPFGGSTINPKAPSVKTTSVKKSVSATGGHGTGGAGGHAAGGAGGNAAAAGGHSASTGGHSVSAGGHAAGGNSFSTGGSNVFSQDMPINVHVVNNLKPAKLNGSVSPKVLKQFGVDIAELKKAVNDMATKLPTCAAISAKYGSNVAKKFAFWKYLLKIGVPVAALGGGALYVKSLMDDSEKENTPDGSENDTQPVVDNDTPPNPGIPETPENPGNPNNPNNGEEIYIDPSTITVQDGDPSNDKTSNKHSKPKRINYAGLGSIFNDIGSAIDTTGTNIGSGIGTTLGGIGR